MSRAQVILAAAAIAMAIPAPGVAAQLQTAPVQLGPVQVGSVGVGGGSVQVGPVQAGPVQVGSVEVGGESVEVGPVQAGPVQTGPVEVGGESVQAAPVQAGPVQTAPVEVAPAGGGSANAPAAARSSAPEVQAAPGRSSASGGDEAAAASSAGGEPADAEPAPRRAGDDSRPRGSASAHREVRLRRAVRAVSGCLGSLAAAERRVLVLRSGLGAGPPRSRRAVARILDVRVPRVRRLERTGLRHARALARADVCGRSAAVVVVGDTGAQLTAATVAPHDAAPAAAPGGERAEERGEVRGESDVRPPLLPAVPGPDTAANDLTLAIVLILLAAMAGYATPYLRDRMRRPSPPPD
jgi:hypothetical protein